VRLRLLAGAQCCPLARLPARQRLFACLLHFPACLPVCLLKAALTSPTLPAPAHPYIHTNSLTAADRTKLERKRKHWRLDKEHLLEAEEQLQTLSSERTKEFTAAKQLLGDKREGVRAKITELEREMVREEAALTFGMLPKPASSRASSS